MPLTPELDIYLDELKYLSPDDLYAKLLSEKLPMGSNKKRIQDLFYQSICLLESGGFSINNVTESGIVKRIWSCVDACFDFSAITCIGPVGMMMTEFFLTNVLDSGEKCNKMDYLFLNERTEVGCGKCGLINIGGVTFTKELHDATFKMPQVMKDMVVNLVLLSPASKRKLVAYGLYIEGWFGKRL